MSHFLPLNESGGGAPPPIEGQSPPGKVSRENEETQQIFEPTLSEDSGVDPENSTSSSRHSSGYLCRVNVSWRHSQGRSFKSYIKSQRVGRSSPDSTLLGWPVLAAPPEQCNWAPVAFKQSSPMPSESQIPAPEPPPTLWRPTADPPSPCSQYVVPTKCGFMVGQRGEQQHLRRYNARKAMGGRATGRRAPRPDRESARRSVPKKDEDKAKPKKTMVSVSTNTEENPAQAQHWQLYQSMVPKDPKPQISSSDALKLTWSSYLSPRRQTLNSAAVIAKQGTTTSPRKPRKHYPIKWCAYPEDQVPILQKPEIDLKPKMKTEEEIYRHLDTLGKAMIDYIDLGLYHEHHKREASAAKKKRQKKPVPQAPRQQLPSPKVELDPVEEYVQQLRLLQEQMQQMPLLKNPNQMPMNLGLPDQQPVQEQMQFPQLPQMEVPQAQQPGVQQEIQSQIHSQDHLFQWQPHHQVPFQKQAIQPPLIQEYPGYMHQKLLQELEELRIHEEILEQQKKEMERIQAYEQELARQRKATYQQHQQLQDELLQQLKIHEEWLKQRPFQQPSMEQFSMEQASMEQASMPQPFMPQLPMEQPSIPQPYLPEPFMPEPYMPQPYMPQPYMPQPSMQEEPLLPMDMQSLIDPSLFAPMNNVLQSSLAALYGPNEPAVFTPTHFPDWNQLFPMLSNEDVQCDPSSILPKQDIYNHGDGADQGSTPAKPADMSRGEPVQKDVAMPFEMTPMVAKSPFRNTSNAGDGNDDTGNYFVRAVGDPYYRSPGAPRASPTKQSFPYLKALKQPEEPQTQSPPKSWRAQAPPPPAAGNVAKVPFRATKKQDAPKPRFNQYAGNKAGQTYNNNYNYNAANRNANNYQKKVQAGNTPRTYNKTPFNQRKGQKEPVVAPSVPVVPKQGNRPKTKAQKSSRRVDAQGFVKVGGGGGGGEVKKVMPHLKPAGCVVDRRNPFNLLDDTNC
ncbi:involucrin-like [Drosophila bipectinata]|uniref:involucrin-like n=1 Tax=Drosophila bipectinata TaxID=42026 RepID=UPI0038B2AAE0